MSNFGPTGRREAEFFSTYAENLIVRIFLLLTVYTTTALMHIPRARQEYDVMRSYYDFMGIRPQRTAFAGRQSPSFHTKNTNIYSPTGGAFTGRQSPRFQTKNTQPCGCTKAECETLMKPELTLMKPDLQNSVMGRFEGLFSSTNKIAQLEHSRSMIPGKPDKNYIYDIQVVPDGCCETRVFYKLFNTTIIDGTNYDVVSFNNLNQYVPVGLCKANDTCTGGVCVQRFRHHWLLIWNLSLTTNPPIEFAPTPVPSHCECLNIIPNGR